MKLKEFFSRFNWNNVDNHDNLNVIALTVVIIFGGIFGICGFAAGLLLMLNTGTWWLIGLIPVAAVIKLLVASYRKD
jgi:amino acid transporter